MSTFKPEVMSEEISCCHGSANIISKIGWKEAFQPGGDIASRHGESLCQSFFYPRACDEILRWQPGPGEGDTQIAVQTFALVVRQAESRVQLSDKVVIWPD